MPKTCCFSTSIFSGFGVDFGRSWASKSAALLAAPGVLDPTAFYACLNILLGHTLGGAPSSKIQAKTGEVRLMLTAWGAVLALCWHFFRFFSLLGASYALFQFFLPFFGCLGSPQARFSRVPARSGEGFGGSRALFFEVFECFCMLLR